MNVFNAIIAAVIAIVVILVLFTFVPTIMGSVESAQPALAADSDWNKTHNTDLPDVAGSYVSLAGIIVAVTIIAVVALAIAALRSMG